MQKITTKAAKGTKGASNGTPAAPEKKGKGATAVVATPPVAEKKTKKGATPAPVAPEKNGAESKGGRPKSTGLRKPQVRILQYLCTVPNGATRKEIAAGAPVDNAFCTEYLGSTDDSIRLANDEKFAPSLVTLGYVSREKEDRGEAGIALVVRITPAGRKALQSLGIDVPDAPAPKSSKAGKGKAGK
jgi:hypothetical protein